jgi:glycosyltransferase involved in cell wall biosynthesis
MTKGKILMHVPYSFLGEKDRTSGSRVVPYQLYLAFQEVGYEVDLITGSRAARQAKVIELIKGLKLDQYSFCFSEPSTNPVHPIVDYAFYLLLWANKVPTAIYYTDAYWKFPDLFPLPHFRDPLFLFRYRFDLLVFSRVASIVLFPTGAMADLFELRCPRVVLPFGGEVLFQDSRTRSEIDTAIYVGGIAHRYGAAVLLEAFDLINGRTRLNLELVCRENELEREQAVFAPYFGAGWLDIHHLSGDALYEVYRKSDLAIIALLKNVYNDIVIPVKMFEYLSHGLPMVATHCTETASFITRNRVGLIAEDNPESLAEKILQLVNNPELYGDLKRNARQALENGNLWTDRARFVAEQLAALDKRDRGEEAGNW